MINLSLGEISTPSLVHVTDGVGTPLTGHLMVMVVFEAAVTLSPMFIVTGLPSPTGISRPGSGTSMAGLDGSVKHYSQEQSTNIIVFSQRQTRLICENCFYYHDNFWTVRLKKF